MLYKWIDDNAIELRLNVYSPAEPTFPRANTFLDMCIADSRLGIKNTLNKIPVLEYDSDHRAIQIELQIKTEDISIAEILNHRYLFKKTNWKKFEKIADSQYNIHVPNKKNLTNQEIDKYIELITEFINKQIENNVPRLKPQNSVNKFVNKKIEKLYNKKSYIITQINYFKKNKPPGYRNKITILNTAIDTIKYELKKEFAVAGRSYWANVARKVDYKDPDKFFPKINAAFRKNEIQFPSELHVQKNQENLLQLANIPIHNKKLNGKGEFIINDKKEVANFMGAFYSQINKTKSIDKNNEQHKKVKRKTDEFKKLYGNYTKNSTKFTTFSSENYAANPSQKTVENFTFFTSPEETEKGFKKLNNKTSSGIDNIPNIVLKHLPIKIIEDLTKIFNNCLNNAYFPKKWKIAKTLPFLKANKSQYNASSYRPISLLSNIGEVFEKIFNRMIITFSESRNVIPHEQFGFKAAHSTVHALNKFVDDEIKIKCSEHVLWI